jgi:hypothetical protein
VCTAGNWTSPPDEHSRREEDQLLRLRLQPLVPRRTCIKDHAQHLFQWFRHSEESTRRPPHTARAHLPLNQKRVLELVKSLLADPSRHLHCCCFERPLFPFHRHIARSKQSPEGSSLVRADVGSSSRCACGWPSRGARRSLACPQARGRSGPTHTSRNAVFRSRFFEST